MTPISTDGSQQGARIVKFGIALAVLLVALFAVRSVQKASETSFYVSRVDQQRNERIAASTVRFLSSNGTAVHGDDESVDASAATKAPMFKAFATQAVEPLNPTTPRPTVAGSDGETQSPPVDESQSATAAQPSLRTASPKKAKVPGKPPKPPRAPKAPTQVKGETPLPARGASCLTTTPAKPGVPFPCSTRVTKYNSHDFWAWSDADEKRKAAALGPMLKQCEGIDPMKPLTNERPTVKLSIVGCGGESGRWHRCWIVPLTNATDDGVLRPTCKAGDYFDVKIDNENDKVAIDRIFELDNGAYEMQFYVRKKGVYTFQIDKLTLHQSITGDVLGPLRMTLDNRSIVGVVQTKDTFKGVKISQSTPTPKWPANTESFEATFDEGVDVVPLAQRCDEVTDLDRFRFGAWHRLIDGKCDDIHCTGDGLPERKMEGWVWTSDVCIMKLHTNAELVELMSQTYVVGWGGSTMKQPMSNFAEYYLRKPIFKVFMWQLDALKKVKKRPGFFSYRQWDITPYNSTRLLMLWGGCPNIMAGPNLCPDLSMGAGNFDRKVAPYLVVNNSFVRTPEGPPDYPTLLLMDLSVWRFPHDDDQAYMNIVASNIEKVTALAAKAKKRRPLVVWHSMPFPANSDRGPRGGVAPIYAKSQLFHWYQEDYMSRRQDSVLISRNQITLPLHYGHEFVHFGIHYGASEGMCNTGHERKGYEYSYCLGKTWGDDAVIIAWMNAYAQHKSGANGTTSS